MAFSEAINRRKGKAMAQILEPFESELEPLLPKDKAQDFKARVRRKLNRLSEDVIEIHNSEIRGMARNGAAEAIKDGIHPDGITTPSSDQGATST